MSIGRPPKDIDPVLIEDLAGIGCNLNEIASVVGCSRDTLERRFAANIEKGREDAKVTLRRKQWQVAMTGSPAMLIWLGKQMLGQGERNLPAEEKPLNLGNLPTPAAGDSGTASKPN